jgi:6-phosphogluconolactonase
MAALVGLKLKRASHLLFDGAMQTCRFLFWCGLCLAGLEVIALGAEPARSRPEHPLLWVYFGTYTTGKSKGIYYSQLDLATGKLTAPELAVESTNPSFLALHPNGQFLYAVNEVSSFNGKKSGAVSAFGLDARTGALTPLNQQPSGGDGPCHLNVEHTGKAVLVANYGGGSCELLPLEPDGRLAAATAFIQHHGSSVNPSRQEGPHAHGAYFDPSNGFALVPDLGLDKVMIYRFDPAKGSLEANDPAFASLAPGSGPRHLAFHPSGKYAYVISEMLCTVTAFNYDRAHGQMELFQVLSTLPKGVSVAPNYSTAEIQAHPTGRFVYGSNRGHNSIAVFSVDSLTGRLSLVQNASTQGKTPRGFGIDPTGQYLIAGNQDSDSVVVFRIDRHTGQLTPTDETISVGAPVCVQFLTVP